MTPQVLAQSQETTLACATRPVLALRKGWYTTALPPV